MKTRKTTFALFFGNRGFFPASLIAEARRQMPRVLREQGYGCLMMDARATRYGAVESPAEGALYADFLRKNRGGFDGVILCLPNFGDETGAVAALREAGVPILVQGYPDDMDKMRPELRRDAFCGKISIMDVFCQYGVKFTALKPHVVHPETEKFRKNLDHFGAVCRVVGGVRNMVVGAVGARTTAFKTVRIDEVALQRHGITMETLDLSDVMSRLRARRSSEPACRRKAGILRKYASWEGVPRQAFEALVKLGVVLDDIVREYAMDALALRCWIEMQKELGVSPCVLLSEMNNRGIPAACEVDVGNAVSMHALRLASQRPAACLDWNNNYGDEEDKCILFHCGPVPGELMAGSGRIADHAILANAVGEGCSYGCNVGRISPCSFTFASTLTDSGRIKAYVGKGKFTEDPVPQDFFGCAGVAEIPNLQDVLLHVGRHGFRHHVSVTPGKVAEPVREALESYLGFDVCLPQGS